MVTSPESVLAEINKCEYVECANRRTGITWSKYEDFRYIRNKSNVFDFLKLSRGPDKVDLFASKF